MIDEWFRMMNNTCTIIVTIIVIDHVRKFVTYTPSNLLIDSLPYDIEKSFFTCVNKQVQEMIINVSQRFWNGYVSNFFEPNLY